MKKQAGPFGPVNLSGWVEATSGWNTGAVSWPAYRQESPQFLFFVGIFFHVWLKFYPRKFRPGVCWCTLLLFMLYIKIEMNILSIVFKSRKQPEVGTGNVYCLLGQLEDSGPLQVPLQLINARDGVCHKLTMFL